MVVQNYPGLDRYDGSTLRFSIINLIVNKHQGHIVNVNITDNKYFYIYLPLNIFVSNLTDIPLFQYRGYKKNQNLNYK